MYFCKKINMKKLLLFSLVIISFLFLFSSCGVYHEPCEGVTQLKSIHTKS